MDERCTINVTGEEVRIRKAAVRVIRTNALRPADVETNGRTIGYECPQDLEEVQLLAKLDTGEDVEFPNIAVEPSRPAAVDASTRRPLSKENEDRVRRVLGWLSTPDAMTEAGSSDDPAAIDGITHETHAADGPVPARDGNAAEEGGDTSVPAANSPVRVVFQAYDLNSAEIKVTGNGQTAKRKNLTGTQKTLSLLPGTYKLSVREDSEDDWTRIKRPLRIREGSSHIVKLLRGPPLSFRQESR